MMKIFFCNLICSFAVLHGPFSFQVVLVIVIIVVALCLFHPPRDCNAENLSYASLSAWETQLRNLCKFSFLAPCKVGLDMPAFLVEGSMSAALPMKLKPQ